MFVVAALYHFADFPEYENFRAPLKEFCVSQGIQGTLLLAHEGINGTVAGSREAINELIAFIKQDSRFAALEHKESLIETMPFKRMKVRLKREIVTMGVPQIDPTKIVGTYVSAQEWNKLILDPEVLVIDTRNDYEVELGTFQGAINPQTDIFRQFPEYVEKNLSAHKDKPIAMFCTGGIRCEKSTAYLKSQGFEKVYHLKGGVLKYLEEIPPEESLWEGECFVFDQRIALGHGLKPKQIPDITRK